ncbi:hypothetical protein, partial [Endozoicomonas acroporae]|uniref:hypothetical protein n=1 Tax=Endozoicomonas acroporae TaxID=1701104 RepID=UPI0019D6482A
CALHSNCPLSQKYMIPFGQLLKPLHSVRPEPVEGRRLLPMIDRAKHPSTPLRMNGDGTRQSH